MLIKLFKRALNVAIKIQEKRANYFLLTRMSDKELADIGISRCEIKRIINES